jgi:hypothetical protein
MWRKVWPGKDQNQDPSQYLVRTTTIVTKESLKKENMPYVPPETYLEVSPRRTGKTRRLIEAAVNHSLAGNTVFLQTHSFDWAKALTIEIQKHTCVPEFGHKNLGRVHIVNLREELDVRQRASAKFRGLEIINPRLFVDEFGSVSGDRLCIVDGGYYCSTTTPPLPQWENLLNIANMRYTTWAPWAPKTWPDEHGIYVK